jgi:hypothetical protein
MASYEGLFNQAMSALGYFQSHSRINPTEDPDVLRRYLTSEILRLRAESEVLQLRRETRQLPNGQAEDDLG